VSVNTGRSLQNFGYVTTVPPTLRPLSRCLSYRKLEHSMATEPTTRKDTLKVEKLSLLVLALCMVVLVYVLVRPF
jgi:hypothetical protein